MSSNRLTPKIICTTLLLVFHRKDLREAKPRYSVQNFAQNRPFTQSSLYLGRGRMDVVGMWVKGGGGVGGTVYWVKWTLGKAQSTEV